MLVTDNFVIPAVPRTFRVSEKKGGGCGKCGELGKQEITYNFLDAKLTDSNQNFTSPGLFLFPPYQGGLGGLMCNTFKPKWYKVFMY